MAMSAGSGAAGVQSTPNVTPMIDVMLVVLIIFMVVTPALLAGFNATPPEAVNIRDHPEDTDVDQVLGIDKDGAYYLNKKPIKYAEVPGLLKTIYLDHPDRGDFILYIRADKTLPYEKVLDAMDIAAHNGVHVVAMISDQKPGTVSSVVGDTRDKQPGGKK
jgi:biopolymer transport protein TolR